MNLNGAHGSWQTNLIRGTADSQSTTWMQKKKKHWAGDISAHNCHRGMTMPGTCLPHVVPAKYFGTHAPYSFARARDQVLFLVRKDSLRVSQVARYLNRMCVVYTLALDSIKN